MLRLQYLSPSESHSQGWHGVLGAAAFASEARPQAAPLHGGEVDFPLAHVHTPMLGDAREVLEVWRAAARAQPGSH
ncbi:MAG: hypothetical protein KGJ72_09860, partial [Gammaproteobacteria bacterium]|nr:hypothetical protein [Gammaproteobacteria bacterium]